MAKAAGGLVDEDEVRRMAEQYMGRSKADVKQMQEDIYLKDAIIAGLERYVQELVEKQSEAVKRRSSSRLSGRGLEAV
ncbi:hypothetical protein ATCC90586_010551 [Pythium insidiosum]|nr:hypothetical protein ATCC90586_010551 [Pythium insidiosum]